MLCESTIPNYLISCCNFKISFIQLRMSCILLRLYVQLIHFGFEFARNPVPIHIERNRDGTVPELIADVPDGMPS